MNRRQVLVGASTITAGSIGFLALSPDKALATIDDTSFSVPDAHHVQIDDDIENVELQTTVDYSVESNVDIHEVEIQLLVGNGNGDLDIIARNTNDDMTLSNFSDSVDLRGSLLQSSAFNLSNFDPGSGSITTDITAEIRLIAYRDGEEMATDTMTESFGVTVEDGVIEIDTTMQATGEVVFS